MTGAQVDHLKTVCVLTISDDGETVATPHFILGAFVGILDLRVKLEPIVPIEIASKRALGNFSRDALPRQRSLDMFTELTPRLLEAPNECPWIETRRLAALTLGR